MRLQVWAIALLYFFIIIHVLGLCWEFVLYPNARGMINPTFLYHPKKLLEKWQFNTSKRWSGRVTCARVLVIFLKVLFYPTEMCFLYSVIYFSSCIFFLILMHYPFWQYTDKLMKFCFILELLWQHLSLS